MALSLDKSRSYNRFIKARAGMEIEIKRLGFVQISKGNRQERTNGTWDFNGGGGKSNRR